MTSQRWRDFRDDSAVSIDVSCRDSSVIVCIVELVVTISTIIFVEDVGRNRIEENSEKVGSDILQDTQQETIQGCIICRILDKSPSPADH